MSVMSTTFSALAMNLTFLREQGVLKRMRGTPLPSGSYLAALGANAVTNAAIQIVIVVVAGRLLFGIPWPRTCSSSWSSSRRAWPAWPRSAWPTPT
jgi:ABC-2 type transport system permease protein